LEKQGFIDESRIGISGLSYGGYMTTWMIGHYHIWKAAVDVAAWSNLMDVYNLADVGVTDWEVGGSPWKKEFAEAYKELSPMTYAGQITTPTLILHDTGDPRAPIASSYELYHALKDNGVPVKFIAVPVPGHEPDAFPVRLSDEYNYWVSWFDRYLK
jgi:dipeptidyl aminopeptidase/acylaminoacyl peptidase